MRQQTLNGQTVEVALMAADGAILNEPLTPRDAWTVEAVEAFLKHNAAFQAAYPGATLARVESNRGGDRHRPDRPGNNTLLAVLQVASG